MTKSGFGTQIKGMFTKFPVRDMSWMTGVIFTIGSAVFVANGFFLSLSLIAPQTDFTSGTPYATSVSSVVGTLLLMIGGWTGLLEGLNFKRGEVIVVTKNAEVGEADVSRRDGKIKDEEVQDVGSKGDSKSMPTEYSMQYPTVPFGTPSTTRATTPPEATNSPPPAPQVALLGSRAFIWWPSVQQFRATYRSDLYFWAGFITFIGSLIIAIATVTSITGVINFENTLLIDNRCQRCKIKEDIIKIPDLTLLNHPGNPTTTTSNPKKARATPGILNKSENAGTTSPRPKLPPQQRLNSVEEARISRSKKERTAQPFNTKLKSYLDNYITTTYSLKDARTTPGILNKLKRQQELLAQHSGLVTHATETRTIPRRQERRNFEFGFVNEAEENAQYA
ncbi:hypothetical protein G7Y89_g11141 [Cudoniella acicularis]|uniref:Uncharacterized protein n=1 Tax=Cudoniella acicularis TaxID=354080 RepID=A0A8H4RBF4_9HELO|nr:hypothetical protein G7Y89_g11141 [Cudoniella acicularis]